MTGRGLYNALEAAPDEIHLLEDMEPVKRRLLFPFDDD
jgi:hypothetical protein